MLRAKVDLVVAEVTEATQAAKNATTTIPIVMVAVGDPVAAKLVASLARPGGNVTGLSQKIPREFRRQAPRIAEAGLRPTRSRRLRNSDDDNSNLNRGELQKQAGPIGLQLKSLPVHTPAEIESALSSAAVGDTRALSVVPGPLFVTNLGGSPFSLASGDSALIFHLPEYVHMGGLLAYGPDRNDLFLAAPRTMSIACSRAPSPPSCRSSSRTSSICRSTSPPPRRSASPCRR